MFRCVQGSVAKLATLVCVAMLIVTAMLAGTVGAAEKSTAPTQEQVAFFEKTIRPVLIEHCYKCHGPDKQKSTLRVDSRVALLKGGEYGPSIKPGNAKDSVLILAINHGEELQMPAKQKLPPKIIADLTAWVQMGAPWPNAEPTSPNNEIKDDHVTFTDAQKNFWAFTPITIQPLPTVKHTDWIKSPIDQYVLARMESKGIKPAPAANKRTLIRRATFDLIGLPPTIAQTEAFVADDSVNAFAIVIDRLLASPRYGERWGRHWLDVARYADSNGLDENLAYANAYHYRDYVIRAFNDDKPFDQFVHEQLAGDLLPASTSDTEQQILDRKIATAFLSLGPKMLAEDDPRKMQMDIVDEQVDTVSRAFMGLTMGCARCHDHKFDPLPTADYYSLAAIFKSTKTMENFKVVAVWHEHELATEADRQKLAAHEATVKSIDVQRTQLIDNANEALLERERARIGEYVEVAFNILGTDKNKDTEQIRGRAFLPTGAVMWEAEKFKRSNMIVDTSNYGQGIGILGDPGSQANFVEYAVQLPKPGKYQIELRYAAKDQRPARLLINGVVLQKKAMSQTTGGWYPKHQRWFTEGVFQFNHGENIIRIETAPNALFPHLDQIMLTPEATAKQQLNDAILEQWLTYLRDPALTENPIWQDALKIENLSNAPLRSKNVNSLKSQFDNASQAWAILSKSHPQATQLQDAELEKYRAVILDPKGPFKLPKASNTFYTAEERKAIAQLEKKKKALQNSRPVSARAMGVTDGTINNLRVHYRGNYLTQGNEVPRRFPRIMAGDNQTPIGNDTSGRLQFARWLTHKDHPLTARVMANRIWRWHFGKGIVRTTDNFGRLGERPDQPALLDYLALKFIKNGWSVKQLHRAIMLSATYQMSTDHNERAAQSDPDNRLLWRFNRRRLEAEAIRDSIIFLGGKLDTTMYGQLLPSKNRAYVTGTASRVNTYANNRRSVYQPILRSAVYPVLQTLDFPDPAVPNGNRPTTTVAPQALLMINSDLVANHATHWGTKLLSGNEDTSDEQRIQRLYLMAYSRPANKSESTAALAHIARIQDAYKNAAYDNPRQRAWQSLCRIVLASNEFIYIN